MAVVRHLSNGGYFRIRAITRNPLSKNSRKLASLPNVEIVRGDLLKPETLKESFKEVYGIFGNTTPTRAWGMDKNYEFQQGINLINTVKEILGAGYLQHFIFSSICQGKKKNHQILTPNHFSTKWELEKHIISQGLSSITTVLRPASYFENFNNSLTGMDISESFFPGIVQPSATWQTISVEDIGLWTTAAFNNPNRLLGKSLDLAEEELSGIEMASLLDSLRGNKNKQVNYSMIPRRLINLLEHDIAIMAEWIEKIGYGANINSLKVLASDLGIRTTSLRKWLTSNGYIKNNAKNNLFINSKNSLGLGNRQGAL